MNFFWLNTRATRTVISSALLLLAASLPAQAEITWYIGESGTVAWDTITTNTDGSTIDTSKTSVSYEVVAKSFPDGAVTQIGETTATEKSFLLNEGKYLLGVRARKCFVDDPADCVLSDYAWSDVVEVTQGGVTFGVKFLRLPTGPAGLRTVSQ
jgi:hypothetical protein